MGCLVGEGEGGGRWTYGGFEVCGAIDYCGMILPLPPL